MNRLTRWIAVRRYRIALHIHEFRVPIRWGDPLYGRTREERNKTIGIISDRWDAKAPRPEDYGLPPDTAPTKEIERIRRKQ